MNLQQQVFHEVVVVVEGAVVIFAYISETSRRSKTQRSQLCVLTMISKVGLLQKPPFHHQQRVG